MRVTNTIDLLPNNEYSLQKIVKAFQQGNKNICYTSGVGTGKSYIFMKLVYDYYKDKKVLYIVPKYAVSENIRNYKEFKIIENNVEFETYNYFNNYEKGMLRLNDYDLILIDECHHLGSNIYGTILTKCMHDSSIPCLGLTATPIREDGIDILSYFDTTIKGMTTIEAIKCGYMKPFNYRICLPKDENSLNILMHDITDTNSSVLLGDKRTNVKSAIDYEMSEDILKEIVKQYPKNKWTIFCDKIDSLNEHLPLIHRIFPDYKIYPLHSKHEHLKKKTPSIYQGFETVYAYVGDDNTKVYYKTKCLCCGKKALLTPQEMIEHRKYEPFEISPKRENNEQEIERE